MKWEYLEVVVSGASWSDHAGGSGEVRVDELGSSFVAHHCNRLGDEGWELIGVAGSHTTQHFRLIFKRPKEMAMVLA